MQAILSLFFIIELPNGALSCNLNFLSLQFLAQFFFPWHIQKKRDSITIINSRRGSQFIFPLSFACKLLFSSLLLLYCKNGIKSLVLCYRFIVIKTNDHFFFLLCAMKKRHSISIEKVFIYATVVVTVPKKLKLNSAQFEKLFWNLMNYRMRTLIA